MTSDEQNALRAMLREEVNAAVYASEQRLGERIDHVEQRLGEHMDHVEQRLGERIDHVEQHMERVEQRMERVEQRMDNLETTVASMDERLARTEFVQKQMAVNLVQVASVLDEATIKINDIQRSQIALETKVEENTASLKRDMQKLNYSVRGFMDNVTDAIAGIAMRLDMHRDTPINDAHPESAA